MTRSAYSTAWRTLAALGLLLLIHRPTPADESVDRAAPFEAALKGGDRAAADRLARQILEASRPTASDARLVRSVWRLYAFYGYYPEAERYAQKTIDICEKLSPPNPVFLIQASIELGQVYRLEEDYVRAGNQYELCRRLLEPHQREESFAFPRWLLLNNVGKLDELTGQYGAAEDAYQRAQKVIDDTKWNGNSVRTARLSWATTENNLGWLYHARKRFKEAREHVENAMRLRKELKADDDDVAESQNNLGLCLYSLKRPEEAKPLIARSVDILRKRHGDGYPQAARYEHNLAAVCCTLEEYPEALRLHKDSLAVLEKALGPQHPDVAAEHGYLAWLYAAQARWPEAAVEIDQARRIFHNHIRHVLSAQSENEQLRFLTTKDQPWFHVALTIALQAGADPATNAMAVNWVLNDKAITPEVLGERYVLARQSSGDPTVRDLFEKLFAVREELAARSLRSAAPAEGGDAGRGADLVQREADLSRELGLALKYKPAAWAELPEVQRVLANERGKAEDAPRAGDAVLIDFAKFTFMDFHAAAAEPVGSEQHYAAWVVPPDGPARVIDLGPAAAIDGAVQRLQQTMRDALPTDDPDDARTILTLGEKASEELYDKRSQDLGRLLLGKVYPYAGAYRRWVISPDDNLWLVPWSALVLPAGDMAGRYAVEKHTISLVSSGRALVADPGQYRGIRRTDPVIFANADFGEVPDGSRSKLLFGRLKYSAAEAEAIRPLLRRYTGREPVVLSKQQATESAFLATRSPRALVLSTHGFFLEPKDDDTHAPGNPFLRCGLALAGANRRDLLPAAGGGGGNDGIVFGLEILRTDLRGTDLVVLSACETAQGKVNSGEGVANLQSAFQLAGAQAVVGTLWEVQDKETARLMRDFFHHLADDHMDKAEALRQAQLDRIKERRASGNGRSAHPFFWAAPVLTGQWVRTPDE